MADFRVGGDFFKPANGRYIGVFKGTANGMPQTRTENGKTKTTNTIRWLFDLYNMDGTPVLDPKNGGLASVDGLSSDSVGIGRGVPAKGRLWLIALLNAKGLQFSEPSNGDDVNRMVDAAVGATVQLVFGRSQSGKDGTLTEVEPYVAAPAPAPVAAAPVAPLPVAPVAPAPVAAPAMPAPVAQPAPLPVPTAPPFVPTGASAAIPTMPFPPAS